MQVTAFSPVQHRPPPISGAETGSDPPSEPDTLYPGGDIRDSESTQPDRQQAADAPTAALEQGQLTHDEQREVDRLRSRDREVRTHEMSHKAAAGGYARGGPYYDYEKGPDGRQYAVGGHVDIDVSPVPDDPAATIRKMEVVRRAALAPAEPSSQDRQVAAAAAGQAQKARAELQKQRAEKIHDRSTGEADTESNRSSAIRAYDRPQEKPAGTHLNLLA